jgi:hypothetical protein
VLPKLDPEVSELSESLPSGESPSPSPEPQEDEEDGQVLCRDLDPFDTLRRQLTQLGFERGEYSGIPVPISGNSLVVHPSFSFAKVFQSQINDITTREEQEKYEKKYGKDKGRYEYINSFYSHKKRCTIIVMRDKTTGKVVHGLKPAAHAASEILGTLHASDVWGVDQEQAALQTLGGMLKHRQFKQYLLTGMFLERSKKSHVTYIFRRLRPTIALGAIPPEKAEDDTEATILCCLCMHPIAYYAGSWAGAMCPTDDVIAHLALMRGDEHMFWRRCNQHDPGTTQAGIA